MVLIPSLSSMLLVIGVALAIAVLAAATVGAFATLIEERHHHQEAAPPAAHPGVPVQRATEREPVSTH